MTINLNDCESIEIIARDSAECMHEEYAYIGKKYGPFGTAWKLVRQREQGDTPKKFNVITSQLRNDKTEDIPLIPILFTVSRSH
jgi:hypothetical protein